MKAIAIYITTVVFMLLTIISAQANNRLEVADGQIAVNENATISINMTNNDQVVAFQVDIPIPPGLTYVDGSAMLNPVRVTDHELTESILPSGELRIIGYSMSNSAFVGSSGELVSFQLQAGAVPGSYPLNFSTAVLGDVSSNNIITQTQNGTLSVMGPDISFSVTSVDFGEVPLEGTQSRVITIHNTGNAGLNIEGLVFSSPFFSMSGSHTFTIGAYSSRNLHLQFSSEIKDVYSETLEVHSNDEDQPMVRIDLSAIAFAVNELHTGSMVAFSGDYATLDFRMNNMEPITSFQFDLTLPSPLSFVSGSEVLTARKVNHQVSANMISSNVLRVLAFSMDNTAFSNEDGQILQLGFDVNGVSGYYGLHINNVILGDADGANGVSAYSGGALQIGAADINMTNSVNFGDVSVQDSQTRSLSIVNTGLDTLEITSALFSDASFSSDQTFPLNINPGVSTTLDVTFSNANEGVVSGIMKLISNDPDESPFAVSLFANVFIPNYIIVNDSVYTYGDTMFVDINVDNMEPFTGFQFDLNHTESLTCLLNLIEPGARAGNHIVQGTQLDSQTIRLLSYSLSQDEFSGNSGAIVRIPFVGDSAVYGSIQLSVEDAILGNAQSENILWGVEDNAITIARPQEIIFSTGWNIVSFNVVPQNNNLTNILQPLIGSSVLLKVSDESGGFMQEIPGLGWVNTIGDMQNTEGYYIKVSDNDTLYLDGLPIELPYTIPLYAGWNIMGYPKRVQENGITALTPIINNNALIKVIDESGGFIQNVPGIGWLNSIGNFKPGEGYYVKVNSDADLTFEHSEALAIPREVESILKPVYFNSLESGNYYMPMHFVITDPQSTGLCSGDEIGIFDQDLCVGSAVYQGENPLLITVGMDDPDTPEVEGYQAGHTASAKVFFSNVYVQNTISLQGMQDLVFQPLETWVGDIILDVERLMGDHVVLEQNKPNPVESTTVIEYSLPVRCQVQLSLLDGTGKMICVLEQSSRNAGIHSYELNADYLPAGVYFYRMDVSIQNQSITKVKRLVKNY